MRLHTLATQDCGCWSIQIKGVARHQKQKRLTLGDDVSYPCGAGLGLETRLVFDGGGKLRDRWPIMVKDTSLRCFQIHHAVRMMMDARPLRVEAGAWSNEVVHHVWKGVSPSGRLVGARTQ